MKLKLLIFLLALAVAAWSFYQNKNLHDENKRLKANQEALLIENEVIIARSQRYKVADSLNAVKISALQLSIDEYKRYKAEDYRLIKQLKSSSSDLQKVISAQTTTIDSLSAKLNSVIRFDTATQQLDTLKCFDYKNKWSEISGCIAEDTISLQIKSTESLKVIEAVTYKRFLGFLWKTNKIKKRDISIVSENPNTIITNVDYINIEN